MKLTLDTEVYHNYFLAMIASEDKSFVQYAEMWPGKPLGVSSLPPATYITFNGNHYDLPILSLALAGADCATLKRASDDIIQNNLRAWDIRDKYGGVDLRGVDHIDIMEVAPGRVGLKTYGGRLHSKKLQELPIEPDAHITEADRVSLKTYCLNDNETTWDLYRAVEPQMKLRESMSAEYGIDLRSKSDAQIAEAVIVKEVETRLGYRIQKPDIHPQYSFKYKAPNYIHFSSPGMKHVLDLIHRVEFTLNAEGKVEVPKELRDLHIRIGNGVYRMGNGGLHSCEHTISHKCDLIDRDFSSFYPLMILGQGLYPPQLTEVFLEVYRSIVNRRLEAKRAGDTVTADSLKIVINGSFGKFGSRWSKLYSPNLLIQTTITGQLIMLMAIEMLELAGVEVVSANTDGLVMKAHPAIDPIIAAIELAVGFDTEATHYVALYSRDVNNYIAIKPDGKTKLKGVFASGTISKNPQTEICVDAAIAWLLNGTPIDETINSCRSIKKFIAMRKVDGGGQWDGTPIGKMVRWYYGINGKPITYSKNGNRVPKTEGAIPVMALPDELPNDIDFAWYYNETVSILRSIDAWTNK